MKYFKQSFASGNHDRTVYGSYDDSDITPQDDINSMVYSVDCDHGNYYYECYEDFFEPDEITEIAKEEYRHVVEQLQKVDELQAQIDKMMKALIK